MTGVLYVRNESDDGWYTVGGIGIIQVPVVGGTNALFKANLVIVPDAVSPLSAVTVTADELAVIDDADDIINLQNIDEDIAITVSGAGGLDTGSEASSTMYYIWIIYNSTTTAVAGLLSESASDPTLPSGYDYYRLVGEIYNDSSSDFVPMARFNDRVHYRDHQQVLLNQTVPASWTQVTIPTQIPITGVSGWFLASYSYSYSYGIAQNWAVNSSGQFHCSMTDYSGGSAIYYDYVVGNYLYGTWGYLPNITGEWYWERGDQAGTYAYQTTYCTGYILPR